MIVTSLTLKNFMNISEANLDFKTGVNVLYGENGQGKSSVFEAIAFMLYDRKKSETWKDYIKNGEKSFTLSMVVQMSDNPIDLMTFDYYGSRSAGSVEKKVVYGDKTYSGSSANTFLSSTFDQEMFENVLFNLQDGKPITALQPSQRRDIFKKIFNSDFPEVIQRIEQDQASLSQNVVSLRATIDALINKKYNLFRIIEIDESEINKLKEELEKSQASELDKQKYKFYAEKIKELNSRQIEMTTLSKRKEDHQKAVDSYYTQIDTVEKGIFPIKEKVLSTQGQVEQQTKAAELLLQQKKEHNVSLDVKAIEKEMEIMEVGKAGLMAQIQLLTKHKEAHLLGECETCGQKCDSTRIPEIEKAIELNKQLLHDHQADLLAMKAKIKEYQLKSAKFITDYHAVETFLSELKSILGKLFMDVSYSEGKITTIKSELIPKEKNYIESIDKSITELEEKIVTLVSWCNENKVDAVTGDAQVRSVDLIQKETNKLMEAIQANIQQEKLNQTLLAEKKLDQIKIQIKNQELNGLQIQIKNLDAVKKLLTIDFPSFINIKACVILQEYMNTFFNSTKDAFEVQLTQDKKGINFFYKARGEKEYNNAKMVSGFESALLTLGFKVSVARAYQSKFIILDEIDAKASDTSSEKLFQTITNIGGFQQIFIITHKSVAMEHMKESGALIYRVENGTFTNIV